MSITVTAKLTVYEIDGHDKVPLDTKLLVSSHWNRNSITGLVVLTYPGGPEITVDAQDLLKAVKRCIGLQL